jgi:hypothetical protein
MIRAATHHPAVFRVTVVQSAETTVDGGSSAGRRNCDAAVGCARHATAAVVLQALSCHPLDLTQKPLPVSLKLRVEVSAHVSTFRDSTEAVEVELALERSELSVLEVARDHFVRKALDIEDLESLPVVTPANDDSIGILHHHEELAGERSVLLVFRCFIRIEEGGVRSRLDLYD